MRSLKEQVADLEISGPRDQDPEELEPFACDNESISSRDEGAGRLDGREHYEEVGKSTLRKPDQPTLGKQYSGAAVSRGVLDNDSDEDPFAPVDDDEDSDPFARNGHAESEDEGSLDDDVLPVAAVVVDEDEEIDSNEAFGEGDEETFKSFKFLGSRDRKTRESLDASEALVEGQDDEDNGSLSDSVSGESRNDSDLEMEDIDSDLDDDSQILPDSELASSPQKYPTKQGAPTVREKLKALLSNDAAAVASSLSAAAHEDAKKGKAVKQQYQTFDRLLDARIKLQKGLSASNDLTSSISNEEDSAAIRKAEEAALNLWSTIESLRSSISNISHASKTPSSKKRKDPSLLDSMTSTADLWTRTQSLETAALQHRRIILNKWSTKTRTAASATPRSQLLNPSQQSNPNYITAVLDTYLATESEKLVVASSAPPSKATNRNTPNNTNPSSTYTDDPFYQSLLRDLIASRSANTDPTSHTLSIPAKLHTPGSFHKRATIDTKASKGRKVRYTVHEKLQNFGAPEDRSTWSLGARGEFFGSLFGGTGGLGEDDVDGGEEGGVNGDGEEALRLFRS